MALPTEDKCNDLLFDYTIMCSVSLILFFLISSYDFLSFSVFKWPEKCHVSYKWPLSLYCKPRQTLNKSFGMHSDVVLFSSRTSQFSDAALVTLCLPRTCNVPANHWLYLRFFLRYLAARRKYSVWKHNSVLSLEAFLFSEQ